jgi:protein ImuA
MFFPMAHPPSSLPRLAPARVHEAGGPAAPAFALTMAAQTGGPVIWIRPAHAPERLMPWAVRRFLSPARLLMVEARGEADLLWATEESLRAGAAGFVIAAPEKPLSLTAGRRLQLAAEAGRTTGLLLIREEGGSNAAETRWHCTPLPADAPDSTRARWSLKKNKKGTMGEFTVHWHGTAHSVPLVAPAGERDVAAPPPA